MLVMISDRTIVACCPRRVDTRCSPLMARMGGEAKHAVRLPGQGSSEQGQKPIVPGAHGPARGRAAGQGCRCQDVPSASAARGQGVGREGRLGPGKVGQEQDQSRADVNRPLFRKPWVRRSVVSVCE